MRIEELRLWTGDLGALRAFYATELGLPLVADGDEAFTVRAGATRLTFLADPAGAPTYHFAFNIPRNLLPAAKAWLGGRAELLTRDGEDEFASSPDWNARMVYFLDPAGNILELIARQNLANDAPVTAPGAASDSPPGPFGPEHVLNVSEIGVPTDDVPATVARLRAEYGLAPFGDQSDSFAPVGDEEGLFIVVRRGRHWFPTDRAAGVFRCEWRVG